jgi:hypothetical protein
MTHLMIAHVSNEWERLPQFVITVTVEPEDPDGSRIVRWGRDAHDEATGE